MGRKKIGSNRAMVSPEDNLDAVGFDELEEVSSIGDSRKTENDSRRATLSMKIMDVRNRRSSGEEVTVNRDLECTCDLCMKSFFRKEGEVEWHCPYCGHKFEAEYLEEVDTMQENPYKDANMSDEQSKERKRRLQTIFHQRTDTWQDGRKEQLSLEMGSDEYGEYVDDLANNRPDKEDDSFHARLAQRNADLVTKQYDSPKENEESAKLDHNVGEDSIAMQKREEMQKRDLHDDAVREAIAAASVTASTSDDQLARSISAENVILYNRSIKPDEYIEALKDYVVEPSL